MPPFDLLIFHERARGSINGVSTLSPVSVSSFCFCSRITERNAHILCRERGIHFMATMSLPVSCIRYAGRERAECLFYWRGGLNMRGSLSSVHSLLTECECPSLSIKQHPPFPPATLGDKEWMSCNKTFKERGENFLRPNGNVARREMRWN